MTDETIQAGAAELWRDLYVSVFGRRRHAQLWAAMASVQTGEKVTIDEDAEKIIADFLLKWSARGEKGDGK